MYRSFLTKNVPANRRGMAPLEMVLIFPIFLAVLCCAMWVAGMMIRKSEVTVLARYKGDAMRYSEASISGSGARPFEFTMPAEGRVSASHETQFRFSGIMPVGRPSARHTLLLNSWDYRQEQMRMDKSPNYDLAFRLAAEGPGKSMSSQIMGAVRLMNDLKMVIGSILHALQANSPTQALSSLTSLAKNLGNLGLSGNYGDALKAEVQSGMIQSLRDKTTDMLAKQVPELKEAIDLYRQIQAAIGEAKEEVREKAETARKQVEQLEQGAKLASKAMENSDKLLTGISDAMSKAGDKPEDRKKAFQESSKKLLDTIVEVEKLLTTQADERNRAIMEKTVSALVKQHVESISTADPRLRNAIDTAKVEGLRGIRKEIQKISTELEEAIGEGDKETEEDLMMSLRELTQIASKVVADADKMFSEMAENGARAEADAKQQLENINMQNP